MYRIGMLESVLFHMFLVSMNIERRSEMLRLKLFYCLSKVRSLITLHCVNQLHRLLIRFSWTENILLINAVGGLRVSDCVCV